MTIEEYESLSADQAAQITALQAQIETLEEEKSALSESLKISRESNDKLLKLVPMVTQKQVEETEEKEESQEELIAEYLEAKGVKRNA